MARKNDWTITDIQACLDKTYQRALTVTAVRFLLHAYKLPYSYDDFYKELHIAGTSKCVARGTARDAVAYLMNRLDKAGII